MFVIYLMHMLTCSRPSGCSGGPFEASNGLPGQDTQCHQKKSNWQAKDAVFNCIWEGEPQGCSRWQKPPRGEIVQWKDHHFLGYRPGKRTIMCQGSLSEQMMLEQLTRPDTKQKNRTWKNDNCVHYSCYTIHYISALYSTHRPGYI